MKLVECEICGTQEQSSKQNGFKVLYFSIVSPNISKYECEMDVCGECCKALDLPPYRKLNGKESLDHFKVVIRNALAKKAGVKHI